MELLQLRYFCDAAQTENFSQTARKYQVPTSNISQTIKRLESELGTELFHRRKNHIFLNEQGRVFYQGAKAALEQLEDTKLRLQDVQESVNGEIKILALVNRRIITKTIEIFRELYPEVSFLLRHSYNANPEMFDLVISDGRFTEENYSRRVLYNEDVLLAVKEGHWLAEREKIQLSDLQQERFITMPRGSSLYDITNRLCAKAGFMPQIAIEIDDPYYVRRYVELGLGVALVPSLTWKGEFSSKIVLRKLNEGQRTTYIYLPDDRYLPKSVKLFARMLEEEAQKE